MYFKFSKSNAKNQAKSADAVNTGMSSDANHPYLKTDDILEDDIENLESIADNPTPNLQNKPNIIALGLLAIVLSAMGIVATSSCGGSLSFKIPFELTRTTVAFKSIKHRNKLHSDRMALYVKYSGAIAPHHRIIPYSIA